MSGNNLNLNQSKRQGDNPYQPQLFKPGNQGWQNPIPIEHFFQNLSPQINTLTTEEIQKFLGISPKLLRNCPIGAILEWNAYLIRHLGRNSWKVYEEKLTV